jgi:hypothetical protein
MARDFHNHRLRHTGLSHVRVEGVSEIVENESVRCTPSIGNPYLLAGPLYRCPHVPDRPVPEGENVAVMDRPRDDFENLLPRISWRFEIADRFDHHVEGLWIEVPGMGSGS